MYWCRWCKCWVWSEFHLKPPQLSVNWAVLYAFRGLRIPCVLTEFSRSFLGLGTWDVYRNQGIWIWHASSCYEIIILITVKFEVTCMEMSGKFYSNWSLFISTDLESYSKTKLFEDNFKLAQAVPLTFYCVCKCQLTSEHLDGPSLHFQCQALRCCGSPRDQAVCVWPTGISDTPFWHLNCRGSPLNSVHLHGRGLRSPKSMFSSSWGCRFPASPPVSREWPWPQPPGFWLKKSYRFRPSPHAPSTRNPLVLPSPSAGHSKERATWVSA